MAALEPQSPILSEVGNVAGVSQEAWATLVAAKASAPTRPGLFERVHVFWLAGMSCDGCSPVGDNFTETEVLQVDHVALGPDGHGVRGLRPHVDQRGGEKDSGEPIHPVDRNQLADGAAQRWVPEATLEWKISQLWNAIERNRARAYAQAYTALVALNNLRSVRSCDPCMPCTTHVYASQQAIVREAPTCACERDQ